MTRRKLLEQLKRLKAVSRSQWRAALAVLMLEIAYLLHGHLKENKYGRKYLVGGYTEYGAHSEENLCGDPLYHYQSVVVEKLFDGSCEWKAENSLAEQLKKIAANVISNEVDKFKRRQKREERTGQSSQMVSLDEANGAVNRMEQLEADPRHLHWEQICAAADGDEELERYVQAVGESKQLKDVREALGLKAGDSERLQKKLKRRVKKGLMVKGSLQSKAAEPSEWLMVNG